jgi:ubiquinone/menaquinone biosynthesis C-methylase UbiE
MSWDIIWQKKGSEDSDNLNKLSGFDLHYDDDDISHKHVEMIIDNCNISKDEKILEVGCGAGRLGNIFLKKDYDYFGLEKSSSLVSKFKNLIDENKVDIMNDNKIPFEDNTFDIVFCYSVVQYLKDEDSFTSFLNEMLRISKKMVGIYDLETLDSTKNMRNKYIYDVPLDHLCISKEYFKNIEGVSFNNLHVTKPTRYNAMINKNHK